MIAPAYMRPLPPGTIVPSHVVERGVAMRLGGVLYMHPETAAAFADEVCSLEGYRDAMAETRLRSAERERWADDGGAPR